MRNTADAEAILYNALVHFAYEGDYDFSDPDNLVPILYQLGDALFVNDEGVICISLEHEHTASIIGDYYGEFRGGYPWISPAIEDLCKAKGFHVEWQNPGCICFHD